MTMRKLTIDGMLSGTGIRDTVVGGYLDPNGLGISADLVERIAKWLLEYEKAHCDGFEDKAESERLDHEGVVIVGQIREELPGTQVGYFSNAEMRNIAVP